MGMTLKVRLSEFIEISALSLSGVALSLSVITHEALAQTADAAAPAAVKLDTGDTAWMLTATALGLLMTIPGLGLFSCGIVRQIELLATVNHELSNNRLAT